MCDHVDNVDELSASDDAEPEEQPSRAPFDPELDHDDDDEDDDDNNNNNGEAVVSAAAAQTPFSLRGGSSDFSNRSHSIFDCLDTQLSSSTLKQHNIIQGKFIQQPPHCSRKASQPSATSPVPPKKRGVPDYLVHPERWTHYSLEDVAETSDHDNRRAAHQFLSVLQQGKQTDLPCNVQQRMVFSRPKRPLKEQMSGQLSAVRRNQRGMHLSHLEVEGDEEEGSELEKAGGRRTDQSENKTEEKESDEEKDTRTETERQEEDKLVQKEKDDEEEKVEEVNHSFASFRKARRKNYRKSSEQEEN